MAAGRPTKYDPSFCKQAKKLCLLGATDKDLAMFFDVVESTINEWKLNYPEFSESIKGGKLYADSKVVEKLYKRAVGYKFKEYTHEKIELKEWNGDAGAFETTPATRIKCVEKLIVPDTTAQIFWLKNRQPQTWRDKQEIDHTSGGNELKRFTLNVKPDTSE